VAVARFGLEQLERCPSPGDGLWYEVVQAVAAHGRLALPRAGVGDGESE
jgi:hypothetical protein